MNMVNSVYARAAEAQQPALQDFLTKIFTPIFGKDARRQVDEIAKHMGRNVAEPETSR